MNQLEADMREMAEMDIDADMNEMSDEAEGGIAYLAGMDEGLDQEEMVYGLFITDPSELQMSPDLRAMYILEQVLNYLAVDSDTPLTSDDLDMVDHFMSKRIEELQAVMDEA